VEILDLRSTNLDDHSVSQFLDILFNQEMQRREMHLIFPPSKAFEKDSQIALVGHFRGCLYYEQVNKLQLNYRGTTRGF